MGQDWASNISRIFFNRLVCVGKIENICKTENFSIQFVDVEWAFADTFRWGINWSSSSRYFSRRSITFISISKIDWIHFHIRASLQFGMPPRRHSDDASNISLIRFTFFLNFFSAVANLQFSHSFNSRSNGALLPWWRGKYVKNCALAREEKRSEILIISLNN